VASAEPTHQKWLSLTVVQAYHLITSIVLCACEQVWILR
jgi:hypothetical protein